MATYVINDVERQMSRKYLKNLMSILLGYEKGRVRENHTECYTLKELSDTVWLKAGVCKLKSN